MKEFKGNAGEWSMHDKRPHCNGIAIWSGDQYIGFVGDSDSKSKVDENARLIVAATDLLRALESLILFTKPMKSNAVALHVANEAIKKALGE